MKRQRQLQDGRTALSAVSNAQQQVGSNLTKVKDTKLQQSVTEKSDKHDEREMFVYRLNTLQASACRCCAQAPSQRTRCCHWCGVMKNLITN